MMYAMIGALLMLASLAGGLLLYKRKLDRLRRRAKFQQKLFDAVLRGEGMR